MENRRVPVKSVFESSVSFLRARSGLVGEAGKGWRSFREVIVEEKRTSGMETHSSGVVQSDGREEQEVRGRQVELSWRAAPLREQSFQK
jgi:hypothetical protein